MPHIQLPDGESLYFEKHGSGPALLMVAGLGGVGTFWQRHVAALARHFTVVLHDHRGCGRSAHSLIDYSVEQMAGDVLALMDRLGIDKASLIGHSTGGAIGQVIALDHPQRLERLVLSATWPAADGYMRRLFDVRAEALQKAGEPLYRKLGNLLMYPPAWLVQNVEALEASQARGDIPATPDEIARRRIDAIMRFDRSRHLAGIRHRTLVLCARDDLVTPSYFSEALGRAIPQARLVILPSGGHFYPHVCQGEFKRLALEFLAAP